MKVSNTITLMLWGTLLVAQVIWTLAVFSGICFFLEEEKSTPLVIIYSILFAIGCYVTHWWVKEIRNR